MLDLERYKYHLTNVTARHEMLGRYGTVVAIPYKQGTSSLENMAGAVKTAVEAKTRLPLDSFRQLHASGKSG
ncbi:hypothetical protein ABBQ38_013589 [Trebouxia sp. C0009 RCD-2024]